MPPCTQHSCMPACHALTCLCLLFCGVAVSFNIFCSLYYPLSPSPTPAHTMPAADRPLPRPVVALWDMLLLGCCWHWGGREGRGLEGWKTLPNELISLSLLLTATLILLSLISLLSLLWLLFLCLLPLSPHYTQTVYIFGASRCGVVWRND